ncbi:TIGR03746 family integrating conjugative element protein, partial [Pseudomonas aeruginosa]|uniref:PFL_4703 family integrating conjugative element protein n=1 Tax=Pseudomonas aeruginosa TaxID=287 RepID=UPI00345B1819
LSAYLTPSCRAFLQQDYEYRRASGELRQRVRGIYEIPGRGYGDDPASRVKMVSDRDWIVMLDVSADEYYGSEQVKRALVRYPIKVVRLDIDPEQVRRNNSLSAASNGREYLISVQRDAGGLFSNPLHDRVAYGDE